MSGEKTELPTPKRLCDARKDGQTSKSADVSDALAMSCVAVLLWFAGRHFGDMMRGIVAVALEFSPSNAVPDALIDSLYKIGMHALAVVVPCVLASALAATVSSFAQVGVVIAMKPVVPKLDNVNPAAGLKRVFSLRTVIELIKAIVKAALVGAVMWYTLSGLFPLIVGSLHQPLAGLSTMFWTLSLKLVAIACVVFLVVGAVDLKLQKIMFIRQMKMSKDDIKREYKQQEGDPMIKGERLRLAREMATSAPEKRQAVGLANVVLVNPTHFAVALRYAPHEHPLPRVIEKGMDNAAALIRRYADELGTPVIGNPPVARALYKVDLGSPVPRELHETVAAILRWVDALGARRGRDHAPSVVPAS
ncbi:type III secretion system protein HrcU [Burkholderia ubonensis]|uniref:Secretion apparatus protein BsaZ n=1 Tax=Burkholderia ubonensis TaxID=101571 RepID=A0AB73FSH9_9BURK|nr:type III secretion system export apparatus subunit SctU [Burkholderia ubonensis]KVK72781.1 type III secretion system protein HrcU [Burkholderia ubonensis]KVL62242.1 type III secretion system protein HrcU [Burkholderia ubonensis]KVM22009.1 type III secretion system protein HrcU [Burkholderia ubonensis]KVM33597.1 type III secretion system protein HrcU [Burkholderia ubonensis]